MSGERPTGSVEAQTAKKRNGHYDIEGLGLVPSVTTILQVVNKPGLLAWYGKIGTEEANRIKQESADFGSTVHQLIHRLLQGESLEVSGLTPEIAGCLSSVQEWMRLVEFRVLGAPERLVYSVMHRYAGTLDCLAEVYGRTTLIDWKTSSGIYPEYALQLVAYDVALREMGGESVESCLIVRMDRKTGQCSPHRLRVTPREFEVFLAVKHLWEYLQSAPLKPGA